MEEKTNTVAQVDNTIHFKARNINFSYIKEMIKKNKSVLILMFFGITVLGFLMGVSYSPYGYYSNSESPYEIFDYGDDINVFGVFISIAVPIVLATILNYWMYSRRNVDFIASMPINRRTMGISNIVLKQATALERQNHYFPLHYSILYRTLAKRPKIYELYKNSSRKIKNIFK